MYLTYSGGILDNFKSVFEFSFSIGINYERTSRHIRRKKQRMYRMDRVIMLLIPRMVLLKKIIVRTRKLYVSNIWNYINGVVMITLANFRNKRLMAYMCDSLPIAVIDFYLPNTFLTLEGGQYQADVISHFILRD